jgi:hypothetical protein
MTRYRTRGSANERLVVERVAVELRVRLEAHASRCERGNTHRISVGHTQAAEFGSPEIPNVAFLEKPHPFRIADDSVGIRTQPMRASGMGFGFGSHVANQCRRNPLPLAP